MKTLRLKSIFLDLLLKNCKFVNIEKYFSLGKMPWISRSSFYQIQRKNLLGVVEEAWRSDQKNHARALQKKQCVISEVGG